MLEIISNDVRVMRGDAIPLESVVFNDDMVIGGNNIQIRRKGLYRIDVDAVATSDAPITGTVGMQISVDGVLSGISSEASVIEDEVHSLSTSFLVQVDCAPRCISVINVGNNAIFDMNVIVGSVA